MASKKGVKYGLRVQADRHPNQWTGTPQQEKFLVLYLDPSSQHFGNAYTAAMEAGYSESYARIVAAPSVHRAWLQEARNLVKLGPEHIAQGITQIATDRHARDGDKLRALELLGKLQGLFVEKHQNLNINIEAALNELE